LPFDLPVSPAPVVNRVRISDGRPRALRPLPDETSPYVKLHIRGKTHLSVALGVKALEAGHTVLFLTLESMITRLTRARMGNRVERQLIQFVSPKVLIIDEMGYLPMNREEAGLFFRLLTRRYEKASTIITSNKSFVDWGEIFNDQVLATAILDRLLHHCTTLNIKGESYRLKEKRRAGLFGPPPKKTEGKNEDDETKDDVL